MAEHEEPEKIWDEHDWERFLRQQDRKTDQYMELLEKYIDDPDRDQIIAREMGWNHLLDDSDGGWSDEMEAMLSEELKEQDDRDQAAPDEAVACSFESHPLYKASFALTVWIDQLFDEIGDVQKHPSAVKLATSSAVACGKLAAALSGDETDELGMTIAYLKRALRAITTALEAGVQLKSEVPISEDRYATLQQRLFQIRDGIIAHMGEYRSEWRRRFGPG
jgi:hypothetical protein